jgi:hypothetical protein
MFNNNYGEFTERIDVMDIDNRNMMTPQSVTQAVLNYDIADAHGQEDLLYQPRSAPVGNYKFFNTDVAYPMKRNIMNLEDFPDYSDEILSDYKIAQMLGKPMEMPNVVDLDTSPNYVDFIKESIVSQIRSENEFDVNAQSSLQKILDWEKQFE